MNIFNNKPDITTQNPNDKIIYNYGDTNIYLNQYSKTLSNSGIIELPFINPKGMVDPNLIVFPSQRKYTTERISIIKKTTPIRDFDFDGYLLIRHTPSTNEPNPFYSVVLLKTVYGISEENIIDKIIQHSNKTTMSQVFDKTVVALNLNPYLAENRYVLLNKKDNIVIFPKPIFISSKFNAFSDTPEFDISYRDTNYITIHAQQTPPVSPDESGSIMEGLTNPSDIDMKALENQLMSDYSTNGKNPLYINCQPITDSANKDTKDVVVMDGVVLNNLGEAQMTNTAMNFIVFILILFMVISFSPFIYKGVVVSFIETVITDSTEHAAALKVMDVIILILWLWFSLWICITGTTNNSVSMTSIGVFMIIYLLMTTVAIILMKVQNPSKYNLTPNFMDSVAIGTMLSKMFFWLIDFSSENWFSIFLIFTVYVTLSWGVIYYLYTNKLFSSNSGQNTAIYNSFSYMVALFSTFLAYWTTYMLKY
jgi:hypothetical protein